MSAVTAEEAQKVTDILNLEHLTPMVEAAMEGKTPLEAMLAGISTNVVETNKWLAEHKRLLDEARLHYEKIQIQYCAATEVAEKQLEMWLKHTELLQAMQQSS